MGEAIKYLYSQFILRDVLSFITPGAIVLLSATHVFNKSFESLSIHWLFYVPLFGLAFVTGFAIQCLGEIIGVVSFRPNIKITCADKMKIIFCRWREPEDTRCKWNDPENPLGMKKAYEEDQDFWKAIGKDDDKRQGRERVVILTQMCINISISLVIAVIPFAIHQWSILASQILAYIVFSILILSLFWGHRVHVLRRFNREEVIKKYSKRIYIKNK